MHIGLDSSNIFVHGFKKKLECRHFNSLILIHYIDNLVFVKSIVYATFK